MDLPVTEQGNKHVIVFQDYFSKWSMVFPVPDQKTSRIAELLTKEMIPFFGVPEAILTDRGTNLLSHLMLDICSSLGITKLNTMAYHAECDSMVERFNRTLKSMLRKHADHSGTDISQGCYGHTEIHHMRALVKSHRFCYMVSIVVPHPRVRFHLQASWNQQK